MNPHPMFVLAFTLGSKKADGTSISAGAATDPSTEQSVAC
jgi:hypothetical protein